MKRRLAPLLAIGCANISVLVFAQIATATTYMVTNVNDSGAGSLRQAIIDANGNAGLDTVNFSIGGAGVHTINLLSPLPVITSPVQIFGNSQSGYTPGNPVVELKGTTAGTGADGLSISAGGSIVVGLAINSFNGDGIQLSLKGTNTISDNRITGNAGYGVHINAASNNSIFGGFSLFGTGTGIQQISGNTAGGVLIEHVLTKFQIGEAGTGNVLSRNYIGLNTSGTQALGNGGDGVLVYTASNTVGSTNTADRNLISGNGGSGVKIFGSAASGNIIEGNYFGLAADGTKAIANTGFANIYIDSAPNNLIGGTGPGAGNVIAACPVYGVQLSQATGNTIQGNHVGLDSTGLSSVPNGAGIYVYFSPGTTVGGTTAAARNVISGNTGEGLIVQGDATGVQVQGNFIGTNKNGNAALGNQTGVSCNSASFIIGGTSGTAPGGPCTGACNVISGNTSVGVSLNNNSNGSIQVQGNFIGTDVTGTARVPNGTGVYVTYYTGATIGGTSAAARNVISGNSGNGLKIDGNGLFGNANIVTGNFIGTNANGTQALGNGLAGVLLNGLVQQEMIGGSNVGSGNLISGNLTGVSVNPSASLSLNGPSKNIVLGNLIGTDISGLNPIPNSGAGIDITTANSNTIGGTSASARNVISGNSIGISISGGAQSNQIQGNLIGTKINGTEALRNNLDGVRIDDSTNNVIGVAVDPATGAVTGAGNVISGNGQNGINLEAVVTGANNNFVAGNFIGTDSNGTLSVANGGNGVLINGSSANTIGGTNPAQRNVISGNTGDGVDINAPATGNMVLGNYIGTSRDGTRSLPNINGLFITNAAGNSIGATTGTTAGGPCTGACNLISGNNGNGIVMQGSTAMNNSVLGNFIGTKADGNGALGNTLNGVILLAPQNNIGGSAAGARNIISANSRGILIGGADGKANIVRGNFIGTNAAGNAALGNIGPGIRIDGADNTVVGGTAAGTRNVISSNGAEGVDIPTGSGNAVQGNFIGTDATGINPLGNAADGIFIGDGPNNAVGGSSSGAGNTIAYNHLAGVFVQASTGNAILSNSIFSNSALGIDLFPEGVTPNDADDSDPGPNLLQNFPVITSAAFSGTKLNINGSLTSRPNTTYRVELFGNSAADPSGFGEGQIYLASLSLTTDGSGKASFTTSLDSSAGYQKITSTATDPAGNTSEFSASVDISGPPPTPTPTATPNPTATPTATPGLVANVSTRLPVGTDDNVLIEGFIVQGPAGSTKKIIVRAIGPSLSAFGISDALANPTLEIHDGSSVTIASNNDWKITQVGGIITSDQSAEIAASGVAPGNDLESAIIANLLPGSYTAVVRGLGNTVGTGVVDAYDLSAASSAKLVNIATRGLIQPGDKLMIAGFIIQNGPVRAVVRAIGPSLVAFGINNALPDTTLQLRDNNGAIIVENDNWKVRSDGSSQQAELEATSLQPTNDLEAAFVTTLQPGQYTAQVRGKPEGTGIGVVQVYFLQ